jgi:hypothetical protein
MLLPCVSACADKKPSGTLSFPEFLNKENFVHGISQADFEKQMETYSYNGEPITEIIVGCHEDDQYGGGYSASGERFGFENRYRANDSEGYSDYYNSFYTKVALDGLSMPYGIKFTDTLNDVINKIGINIYPDEQFEDKEHCISIPYGEKSSISLYSVLVADDGNEYDYVIEYTETYDITYKTGSSAKVTRTVSLWFSGSYQMFSALCVKVNERR